MLGVIMMKNMIGCNLIIACVVRIFFNQENYTTTG